MLKDKRKLYTLRTAFFLFCAVLSLHADAQRFKGGIIAGVTASQINGDESAGYNKLGLQGGFRVLTPIADRWDASMEMLFAQRGAQSVFIKDNFAINYFSFTMNYVEVPFQVHFRDWYVEDGDESYYRLSFNAGLSYSRLISTKSKDELSAIAIMGSYVRKNDFNYLIGATFYANPHLGITVRTERGIGFLYKPTDWNNPPDQDHWYGHSLYFQLAYMF